MQELAHNTGKIVNEVYNDTTVPKIIANTVEAIEKPQTTTRSSNAKMKPQDTIKLCLNNVKYTIAFKHCKVFVITERIK